MASTAGCVVSTVTASGSGSSTFLRRSTKTECSAVRVKTRLWRGATASLERVLKSAPSKLCVWLSSPPPLPPLQTFPGVRKRLNPSEDRSQIERNLCDFQNRRRRRLSWRGKLRLRSRFRGAAGVDRETGFSPTKACQSQGRHAHHAGRAWLWEVQLSASGLRIMGLCGPVLGPATYQCDRFTPCWTETKGTAIRISC